MTHEKDSESPFSAEELFVSTTDKRGVIETGNQVFYRVSEYGPNELLRQPHNKIRHPDMPKTAFRLMWDSLSQNKPFCAFVKNRSKTGKYYWVYATVIPISSGYMSIRMKPTTGLLPVVEKLYGDVLKIEKESGEVSGGIKLTLNSLNLLGFSSYKNFMIHALYQELEARQKMLEGRKKAEIVTYASTDSFYASFQSMKKIYDRNLSEFVEGVSEFAKVESFYKGFLTRSQTILDACRSLESLSLNMAVTANKLGKSGMTLNLVAGAFQKAAREVISRFNEFGKESEAVTETVLNTGLNFGILRLTIEMMSTVTGEVVTTQKLSDEEKKRFNHEQEAFTKMACEALTSVNDESAKALESLIRFKVYLGTLKNRMVGFDLIRLGGRLEGSRTLETDSSFAPYIQDIMRFLNNVEQPILEMTRQLDEVFCVLSKVRERSLSFSGSMIQIEMLQIKASASSREAA